MATAMTWSNSQGIQGRCDAKCHYAKYDECDCMCGGRYHGRGLTPGGMQLAIQEYGEEVLEFARTKAEKEGFKLKTKSVADLLKAILKNDPGDLLV